MRIGYGFLLACLWTVFGQDSPIIKIAEPDYGSDTRPFTVEQSKVRMVVYANGFPFSVDTTEIPLNVPEVRALMNYQFQPRKGGSMVTLNFPVRNYSPWTEVRRTPRMPQSMATANRGLKLDRALELEKKMASATDTADTHASLVWFTLNQNEQPYYDLRVRNLAWLIQNQPRTDVLRSEAALLPVEVPGAMREQIAALWMEAVAKNPNDREVLERASYYLRFSHAEAVQRMLLPYKLSNEALGWMGEAYVFGGLGVTGIDSKGAFILTQEWPTSEAAVAAREALLKSELLPLLNGAQSGLNSIYSRLSAQNLVSPELDKYCEALRTQIHKVDPNYSTHCPADHTASDSAKVSSGVISGNLLKQAKPTYPQIAKAARLGGTVILSATIGKNGKIKNLALAAGPFVFFDSAYDAVSQWEYKPYTLDGEPVEVLTEIEVNYAIY